MIVPFAIIKAGDHFKIVNGTVTLNAEGRERVIAPGMDCSDLWVSPDGSAIAFIASARSKGASHAEVLKTSVYVAFRSDHFAPSAIVSRGFNVGGQFWRVLRAPSISPDKRLVFFTIPYTMTTWKLMSKSLVTGEYRTIGDESNYCVVWGGERSGELLLQHRYLARLGVIYHCVVADPNGVMIQEEECDDFGVFARRCTRERGGVCNLVNANY